MIGSPPGMIQKEMVVHSICAHPNHSVIATELNFQT